MIFDTHAHYLDERFDEDREELINSLVENNVVNVTEVSADRTDFTRVMEIIDKYDMFYGSLGVHPGGVNRLTEEDVRFMITNSAHKKIVAIGEIGLDYHNMENYPTKEEQAEWFVRQMDIAREVKLPIIVHSRDAAKDTIDLMVEHGAKDLGGVIHCYSYSAEMAKSFLDLGYYIGIDGPITFKNGRKNREVVEYVPLDRLVIETDSPYLTPDPFRGQRNNSTYLKYVVEKIAEIKNVSSEEVERVTYENALKLYRIQK